VLSLTELPIIFRVPLWISPYVKPSRESLIYCVVVLLLSLFQAARSRGLQTQHQEIALLGITRILEKKQSLFFSRSINSFVHKMYTTTDPPSQSMFLFTYGLGDGSWDRVEMALSSRTLIKHHDVRCIKYYPGRQSQSF
jgi:hypothetical protein